MFFFLHKLICIFWSIFTDSLPKIVVLVNAGSYWLATGWFCTFEIFYCVTSSTYNYFSYVSTLSSVFLLSSEEGIWQGAKRLERHYCWSKVSLRINKCKHVCIYIHRDCREGGTWDGRSNNIILCCLVYFS